MVFNIHPHSARATQMKWLLTKGPGGTGMYAHTVNLASPLRYGKLRTGFQPQVDRFVLAVAVYRLETQYLSSMTLANQDSVITSMNGTHLAENSEASPPEAGFEDPGDHGAKVQPPFL
jgi:hypothetical protein